MRSRIVIAVTASLALPLSAQVASVNPQRPGIKWDSMDLGPFFSGSYRVGETVTCKGIAVAVGTKETPATMLFDTELMRFVAAWEGGLAKFTRGRGGLEDVIAADGSANFATGWTTGIGAEIKQDPRERHQGALEGAKFNGIHANGASTVLSYTVGRQAVLESPGSSVKDGIRVYTRTFTIGAGADVKQILAMENAGEGVARLPNHLHGLAFTGQERQAEHLLPIHDLLHRRLTTLRGEQAAQMDHGADVVRHIGGGNGRSLPQFPLRESQRMKAGLAALQPLLKTGSVVLGHAAISGASFQRQFLGCRRCFIAEQSFDLIIGERIHVHRIRGCGRLCRRLGRGGFAAHVFHEQSHDLPDGARAHQARGGQCNADGAFERVFDLDGHQ